MKRLQTRAAAAALSALLLALPTARRAIAQNPALLARDMIGMFAPVDDFVGALGLTVIGTVGEETPYDSARHDCPCWRRALRSLWRRWAMPKGSRSG